LSGDRSGLFWEFVRIKKECNPKWFVVVNVASIPKADKDIITREMGVEPVMFNASLVSAQSRKRLFWTNIKFNLPVDRGILLKDILQADVDEKFYFNGKIGSSQANRVRDFSGKSSTLSANGGGAGAKTGLYCVGAVEGTIRKGMEGQEHLSRAHRDGNRIYDPDGKAPTLSANGGNAAGSSALIKNEARIRKLTPIECERLQGLPDNYTEGIPMTHRYKCLGNAFNTEVIAHIIRGALTPNYAPS
jgi:DNA (cytosine-5)-methyltransferase 3A